MFFSAAIASFLMTYPIVWVLTFFRMTQSVRREGPGTHKKKAGTPTMGGIGFLLAIIAFAFVLIDFDLHPEYLALIGLVLGFALIGFIDDMIKIVKKRNLGLTFWQKITLQTLVAAGFSMFLMNSGHHLTVTPLLKNLGLADPVPYALFSVLVIVGAANAANLTDGLNGLLAGTAGIAFLAFAALAGRFNVSNAATFSVVSAGAILAFLIFNFPRAIVFMGDVGSLAIGAALAGIAIILHKELSLVIIGGVLVLEALSVIIQVASYKFRKKRVLRMAPLHHHFELMGYEERTVVLGSWGIAALLGIAGWYLAL